MMQARKRERSRPPALIAALAIVVATLVVAPSAVAPSATAAGQDLVTDNVVAINETVSDAGFVHPGVGLSADDLRNAQEMVRTGQEPWASYFEAMTATGYASKTFRASNSKSAAEPDVALDPNYNHGSLRGRQTRDSFGALTQALMWTMTGDEVYRKNAIQVLRTWASMNPDGYKYFADAHIHTGHPLYQFLMAAEIIRATEPAADDTPGTQDGYDVVWSAEDDERLLTNFAEPIVNVFNYSNERWMNQHNFGVIGRVATAIYADDTEGYATGVEWFTVNSGDTEYDNGAMAPLMPLIEAGDPANPYGEEFVQVREMGRDQAHGEANIDNFTALARMLDVQGTEVDPTAGTVSTADSAVSSYDFLDRRLLDGANTMYGFMQGAYTPWVEERGEGWNGTISQAYRGRLFDPVSELYYQYKYERGVDVEAEAPWLAELHTRRDGPLYYNGTGVSNFWGQGDKNPEYWVAFPEELAGTAPVAQPADSDLGFDRWSLQLDDRTEIVTEGDATFARANVTEEGTTSVISRLMHDHNGANGLLLRSDGLATLEVLDKEEASGLNPYEDEATAMATVEVPDTGGEWRYVTYPEGGSYTGFYRLTGAEGTTVDLDSVRLQADKSLTSPKFEQTTDAYYLWAGAESQLDLSATDAGGSVAYEAAGLPEGATLDAGTGKVSWSPADGDRGSHEVQIVAGDGESIAARTFELIVEKNRPKMIDRAVADGVDADAVYTTETRARYETMLRAARDASESGTDEEFRTAFEALLVAIDELKLLNPTLGDGSLDYGNGVVTPTVINAGAVDALTDDADSSVGDLRAAYFTLDFGTRYRVSPEEFGVQARFTFGMRSAGTNVYGSNDGITWDLLTERMTSDTNEMETIPVVEEHRGKEFRYLKVQLDEPAPPIDPAYPGIWSFAEFHIFGERSEVPGTVTDVTMVSADAVDGRVTSGDTVTVNLLSPTPVSDVAVTIGGQEAEVTSPDQGTTWAATTELADVTGGGMLPITVDHTTAGGTSAATILGTTDGKQLYASDERNLVDLAGAQVIKADGSPDESKATEAATMFDAKASTFSNIATVGGQADLIWDFGEGTQISVDRLDYLARQHDEGMRQMDHLVFEGSNDLSSWTTLTEPTFKTLSWQNLESSGDEAYRYLRVRNGMLIHIAELRLFGEPVYDIEPLLERADAVDLSAYTRGSQLLFPREVTAVRKALAEPDADEQALAQRLIDAWDLLDPLKTEAPATFEQSWVAASTATADGATSAAANGWRMFDGNTGTYTDTTTKSCTNTVLPTDGTAFMVVGIKYFPRDSAYARATGIGIQGSNDDGATWTQFASTGTPVRGWNTVKLAEPVHYGALRLSGGNGFCNVAELRFIVEVIDKSGLDVYLDDAAALTEADWTADSWAALVAARDAARAVADNKGATQEEVDPAADELAEAIAGLTKA